MSDIALLKKFVNSEIGTPSMKPLDRKIEDLSINIDKQITIGDCDFYKVKYTKSFDKYDNKTVTISLGALNKNFNKDEVIFLFNGNATATTPSSVKLEQYNPSTLDRYENLVYIPARDIPLDFEVDVIDNNVTITFAATYGDNVYVGISGVVIVIPKRFSNN